jgi:hypothetical protein
MKKKKKKLVRVRRTWNLHPATRVERDQSKYNRGREKKEIKKVIEGEL